jgi:hypothetical protein
LTSSVGAAPGWAIEIVMIGKSTLGKRVTGSRPKL